MHHTMPKHYKEKKGHQSSGSGKKRGALPRGISTSVGDSDDDMVAAALHSSTHQHTGAAGAAGATGSNTHHYDDYNDDGGGDNDNDNDVDGGGGGGGGGGAPDGPDENKYVPCPIDESMDEFCFLCQFSATDQLDPAIRDKMMELERRVTKGVNCGIAQKIENVYQMYEKMIRPTLRSLNKPEWTRASIRGHVTGAHGTAQVSILQRRHIEYTGTLMESIRKVMMLRSKTDPDDVLMNWRAVRIYQQMGQHVMRDFTTSATL